MRIYAGLMAAMTLALMAGPAVSAQKTIELPPFTSIHLTSGIDANVKVGGTQSIEASAPDAGVLDEMKIRVVNGELEAWFDWSIFDIFPSNERNVVLTITVPDLEGVQASAGSDIDVTGMAGDSLELEASSGARIDAAGVTGDSVALEASSGARINATGISGKAISIETSSGANIEVEGSCTSASVEVSSGSDIDAKDLQCEDVSATASSGADTSVFASKSVVADASSGGNITVHGSPALVDNETGSGGDVTIED
jgi:hypothetical protein